MAPEKTTIIHATTYLVRREELRKMVENAGANNSIVIQDTDFCREPEISPTPLDAASAKLKVALEAYREGNIPVEDEGPVWFLAEDVMRFDPIKQYWIGKVNGNRYEICDELNAGAEFRSEAVTLAVGLFAEAVIVCLFRDDVFYRVKQGENIPQVDVEQDFKPKIAGGFDAVDWLEKGNLTTRNRLLTPIIVISKIRDFDEDEWQSSSPVDTALGIIDNLPDLINGSKGKADVYLPEENSPISTEIIKEQLLGFSRYAVQAILGLAQKGNINAFSHNYLPLDTGRGE